MPFVAPKARSIPARTIIAKWHGIFEKAEFYFLFCADGDGTIGDTEISEGKTVFVPADYGKVDMTGNMRLYLISYRDAVGEG